MKGTTLAGIIDAYTYIAVNEIAYNASGFFFSTRLDFFDDSLYACVYAACVYAACVYDCVYDCVYACV